MAFYEVNEAIVEPKPVMGVDLSPVQALTAKNGAPIVARNAGTSVTRTLYADPAGAVTLTQPIASVNGRLEAYVQGETPVDFKINFGLSNEYTQRFTPPPAGATGPTGPQGPQGPAGSGSAPWVTLADYPVIAPETDDTARVGRAYAALSPTRGGTLYFPANDYTVFSLPSFANTTSVTLQGAGGRSNGGATTSRIVYTGTAAINAQSSHGFRVTDLQVTYTNPSLVGKLFDLAHAVASDSTYSSFERCTITGTSGSATGATSLISFANAHGHQVRDCLFNYAVCAVRGKDISADYSNRVLIEGCEFGHTSQAPIQSAGQVWEITACTFEAMSNGNAGAYSQPAAGGAGVAFFGCWFGDVNASGTWIDAAGDGLQAQGCYFSGGQRAIALGASSFGATITGNHFEGSGSSALATGVDVGANCKGIVVLGNAFKDSGPTIVTNPLTLVDDPAGSVFQHLSNENTTPLTFFPGKVVMHDWVQVQKIAAPAAPVANNGRVYLEDNGAGKMRLMVRFPTGSPVQVAIEP